MPPFGANCVVRHKPNSSSSKFELDVPWFVIVKCRQPLNAHLHKRQIPSSYIAVATNKICSRIHNRLSTKAIDRFKSFIIDYDRFASVTQSSRCCLLTFQHAARVPRFVLFRQAKRVMRECLFFLPLSHWKRKRVSPPPPPARSSWGELRAVGLNTRRCSALGQDVCVRVVRQENGPAFYQQRPES